MTPKDRARLLDELRPGLSVFVQGTTGEPQSFIAGLEADPERARGVRFTACLVPGINRFDYAAVHPEASMTAFMASEAWAETAKAGRTEIVPLCYSQTAAAIAASAFDLAIMQVTPPDAYGLCSFGVSGDFPPLAWRKAKRRVGLVNPAMARPPRAETIPAAALELTVDDDTSLLGGPDAAPSPALLMISKHVAALISDGATRQLASSAKVANYAMAVLPASTEKSRHTGAQSQDREEAALRHKLKLASFRVPDVPGRRQRRHPGLKQTTACDP